MSIAHPFRRPVARVAFNMRPVPGPWGGSSVFVSQLRDVLLQRGYDVRYDLKKPTDVVFLIDPRRDSNKPFGAPEIAACKRENPQMRVIHRVNECDRRKGTDFMDSMLAEASQVADHTVFIAEWLRDYHCDRWFDTSRSHSVIYNGADPAVFHPIGQQPYDGREPFRIVTHHWSDNILKGFDVYEELDAHLVSGKLKDVEFWVVGRWPDHIKWRAAKTFPPVAGHKLATRLRECHVYLTASRWEPCGMHHVEGAQCGLPMIYHEDGGGIVEAGQRYGIGFRDDVCGAVEQMRDEYGRHRARLFANMPSGQKMCMAFADLVQDLICGAAGEGAS
jgi:glycosyltransferase involved in cell wall biosynthesis